MSDQTQTTLITPAGWLLEQVDTNALSTELADNQIWLLRTWLGQLPTVALAYDQQDMPEALSELGAREWAVARPEGYVSLEVLCYQDPASLVLFVALRYDEGAGAPAAPAQYFFKDARDAAAVLDQYPAPELL